MNIPQGSFVGRRSQVWAIADYAKVQCETSPIAFSPTFMYQSRTFVYPVKNIGSVSLSYSWRVVAVTGEPDPSGPYKVLSLACPPPLSEGLQRTIALCFDFQGTIFRVSFSGLHVFLCETSEP